MQFGIFDHLDDSGAPLAKHFDDRLKLIEAYDRAGFYGYHLAEHHNTRLGFTEDELTYHGKFYDFDHVPIVMKPVQKPYPELWYGTSRPDSIPWAAERGAHIVTLRDTAAARAIIDLYKSEWAKLGRDAA